MNQVAPKQTVHRQDAILLLACSLFAKALKSQADTSGSGWEGHGRRVSMTILVNQEVVQTVNQ